MGFGLKAIGVYIHRFEALKQLWKQFARDYAELGVREHYEDCMRLCDLVPKREGGVELHIGDWEFLGDCETRDSLFADIDVGWWA